MKRIDDALIARLAEQAAASPRRRRHLNLHADYSDPCQRLLNFLWCDSYIRPHRHAADPKIETLIALRGEMGCLIFDESGVVLARSLLAAGGDCPAIMIEQREWHTIVALSENALLLETKAGPFDINAAKEPAAWAEEEGAPGAAAYLQWMRGFFD